MPILRAPRSISRIQSAVGRKIMQSSSVLSLSIFYSASRRSFRTAANWSQRVRGEVELWVHHCTVFIRSVGWECRDDVVVVIAIENSRRHF